MLKKLLSEFWDWAQISFEEYCADESCFYTKYRWEVEEFHFPKWDELLHCTEQQILENCINEDVLTVLALDNEREEILDFIADSATDFQIEELAKKALSFPLWNARWQVAEILKRRDTSFSEKYLRLYQNDPVEGVRCRASFN